MKPLSSFTVLAMIVLAPGSLFASSHREAPISALDHSADGTDWYAFVSYDHPDRVTIADVYGLGKVGLGRNLLVTANPVSEVVGVRIPS